MKEALLRIWFALFLRQAKRDFDKAPMDVTLTLVRKRYADRYDLTVDGDYLLETAHGEAKARDIPLGTEIWLAGEIRKVVALHRKLSA